MSDYSIGEIDALVLKAYRGAGFSWGMAQEAGAAAAWLSLNSLPALDSFATLLKGTDGISHSSLSPSNEPHTNVIRSVSGRICPVIMGSALADGWLDECGIETAGSVQLQQVLCPLILLPFITQCSARFHCSVQLAGNERIDIGATESFAALGEIDSADVTLTLCAMRYSAQSHKVKRGQGKASSLQILEQLAHRTYVPATDASRLAGAGAGLTDND